MERKLKERITGAIILVTLGIIVIPSILDGDVREIERTETLPIPPASTVIIPTGDNQRAIVTAEDASRPREPSRAAAPEPAPRVALNEPAAPANPVEPANVASPTPTAVARTEPSRPAEPKPRAEPPARVEPDPLTQSAASTPTPASTAATAAPPPSRTVQPDPAAGWAVQVGSFASQANADRLAGRLTELDYKAFVSRKRLDGRVMYRVRVGPRATRNEAAELASRLKKDRQTVTVVPHPG